MWGNRAIGALHHCPALQAVRMGRGHGALDRGGDEDVTRKLQEAAVSRDA